MTPEEYLFKVEEFHGHVSPGTTMGGFLVSAAWDILGDSPYLNAVSETVVCLPDAVQLLTPCTLGNGFLQVLDWGKFAVTLYDRQSLAGARAWIDAQGIEEHPLVADWYLRRPEAGSVEKEEVVRAIIGGGYRLIQAEAVRMKAALKDTDKVPTTACPGCGEYHPRRQGELCPACAGQGYYTV
jgi:formylmethanofuran dehydrogenase subunit E